MINYGVQAADHFVHEADLWTLNKWRRDVIGAPHCHFSAVEKQQSTSQPHISLAIAPLRSITLHKLAYE